MSLQRDVAISGTLKTSQQITGTIQVNFQWLNYIQSKRGSSFLDSHTIAQSLRHCVYVIKGNVPCPSLHKIVSAFCVCAYSVPSRNCYEIASVRKSFVTVFGVFYYAMLVIKSPLHHNLCRQLLPNLLRCYCCPVTIHHARLWNACSLNYASAVCHCLIWHAITNRGNFPCLNI